MCRSWIHTKLRNWWINCWSWISWLCGVLINIYYPRIINFMELSRYTLRGVRIQLFLSAFSRIRTRITSNTVTFHAVTIDWIFKKSETVENFSRPIFSGICHSERKSSFVLCGSFINRMIVWSGHPLSSVWKYSLS